MVRRARLPAYHVSITQTLNHSFCLRGYAVNGGQDIPNTATGVDSASRSTRNSRPYGYHLMADDVVSLMDVLKVPKADIVGWSDGSILGFDLAIRRPDRVGKIFAFAVMTRTSGTKYGAIMKPTVVAFIRRAGRIGPTG
jgi:pimeloyl-ACP methyl ester carboxylesterase